MSIYELFKTKEVYIGLYILFINTAGFIITALDKYYAKTHRWRIAEKFFFIVSLMGGAAGVLMGMKVIRHKTLHKSFTIGIPFLFIMNIGCLLLYIYVFYLK
ncbi:DUF1294 domain-containing protein [Geosporobacter ferrireducens]|uniref:DUF1294 domain-containing protein n=1 Tax=Geosporobacter ferrireducens TaxID=1424294 RepID=A0A1D8GND3_9FIRM|nr:DUF1294 domain-containing protein [Geosporobacter ferrireducens]AOT72431.1 hypothetical protein Gferi_24480 [Geosporobacter ferrireducens]MTI56311.1 DUF1294 domain-containing protein [Geosporobacter ferrireducens]